MEINTNNYSTIGLKCNEIYINCVIQHSPSSCSCNLNPFEEKTVRLQFSFQNYVAEHDSLSLLIPKTVTGYSPELIPSTSHLLLGIYKWALPNQNSVRITCLPILVKCPAHSKQPPRFHYHNKTR
jgi:hypothetical protein